MARGPIEVGTASTADAGASSFDPSGLHLLTADDVQGALEQVDTRLEGTLGGVNVLNVRDFGAVGDGVTDDLPAIAEALILERNSLDPQQWVPRFDREAGGVLYFPPGVYFLAGVMMLWFDRLHVVGAGAGRTTLLFHQAGYQGDPDLAPTLWFTDPRFDRRITGASVRDLTVRTDLLLTRDDPRQSGSTVCKFLQVDGLRVSGVEVADSPSFGMTVWDCTDVVIEGCHVHDTHMDGIHLASVTRGVVENCRVDHTGDDAIAVSGENNPDEGVCRQIVVSSNVITRSGSNGIAVFGADGVVISANTVSGTYQAGIGLNQNGLPRHTSNVVIRGNHLDDVGLYGTDTDVLWGEGVPYGIGVGLDDGGERRVAGVVVEANAVGACRNGYALVAQAVDTKVAGNQFLGPITTEQPAPGTAQYGGPLGGRMLAPVPAFGAGPAPVYPAVRVRRAQRVRVDNNVVRPASGEAAVLVEGVTPEDVVRARVSDNTIDRGADAPLGTHGADEIAVAPAGVVAYQGGNDVNGLAIPGASTPA